MPNKTEVLAALNAHASEIEALIERVKTLGLSGFDLKSQGESGLEIRRILNRLTEMCCDVEMRVIDVHRAYGDQPAMTELERKVFRASRADDVSDLTYDAHERMMEYIYGEAA